MLPDEFNHITLIPARKLRQSLNLLPPDPGTYLWFVRGGMSLLEQSSYFTVKKPKPLLKIDWGVHLYTGAAHNLRFRLSQHLRNPFHDQSSPRKSLVALERRFGAVTRAVMSKHNVVDDDELTEWIHENVVFGIETNSRPFLRETEILGCYASPFNIAHRRAHQYSKWLMAWRLEAFPPEWMRNLPTDENLPLQRSTPYPRRAGAQRGSPMRRRTPEEYRELMRLRRG